MPTYYTEDHEWITVDGDSATIGITKHAAEQLGEVVFIELEEDGETYAQGDAIGVVESVKAASDIYAPVSMEIDEANTALIDNPAALNDDPEGNSWLYKVTIKDPSELDGLLSEEKYKELVGD